MDDQQAALVARALAHPARIQIIRMLAAEDECAGFHLFGNLSLAQSTVSQHLACLKEAGIVASHSAGQGHVYCLNRDVFAQFAAEISSIVSTAPTCPPTAGSSND